MHVLRSVTVSATVTVSALAAFAVTPSAAEAIVNDTPSSSASFNGTVRAVATYGSTVFVAGNFTRATDSRGTFVRRHLAAVSLKTGRLLKWHPRTNAGVYAIAAYRGQVYVGGTFTEVNGHQRSRVARLSVSTGGVSQKFRASTNRAVRAIAVTSNRVYLGGDFTRSRGRVRGHLAAYNRKTSQLLTWRPKADARVSVLRTKNNLVWVGGSFKTINSNTSAFHVAALRPSNGRVSGSFRIRGVRPVTALQVTKRRVYIGAGGVGGHLYVRTTAGRELWHKTFDGDVDAISLLNNVVYVGGHWVYLCNGDEVSNMNGDCSDNQAFVPRLAAFNSAGGRRSFVPRPNSSLGVLALGASVANNALAVGGGFTTFKNGAIQQPAFALLRG